MVPQPVFDGELSYKFNLTSLTRQDAEFNAITQGAADQNLCVSNNPAVLTPNNCLLRGIAGTYTRASGDVDWRRTLYTNNGQVITPFLRVRGDVASLEAQNAPGMSNYINTGQTEPARFMPAAGVEYRYPFVDVEPWGTQTVEPIAQLILRPNETEIGKFPNEDAQNLVFSTANLFSIDKFSGWDRVEGGGRVNAGLQYTAQVNRAGSLTMLFGESYQTLRGELLFGDRYQQHRPGERPRQEIFGLRRQRHLSAEPDLLARRPRPFRSADLHAATPRARGPRQFRALDAAIAVRRLRPATGDRVPQPARGNSRRRLVQSDAELGGARVGPLQPGRRPIRPEPAWLGLCR